MAKNIDIAPKVEEETKPDARAKVSNVRAEALRSLGALAIDVRRLEGQLADARARHAAVADDIDALDKVAGILP